MLRGAGRRLLAQGCFSDTSPYSSGALLGNIDTSLKEKRTTQGFDASWKSRSYFHGHFLPDEDNRFLERVQAAVEEEERQAAAAADTCAAKDAIANAEDYRKAVGTVGTKTCKEDLSSHNKRDSAEEDAMNKCPLAAGKSDVKPDRNHKLSNLPAEFYHYYHGSNTDLGTLIEVRRMWDAFIMPRGSRIPPHWVQPSPPADEVWALYLVNKGSTKNQAKHRKRKRENR